MHVKYCAASTSKIQLLTDLRISANKGYWCRWSHAPGWRSTLNLRVGVRFATEKIREVEQGVPSLSLICYVRHPRMQLAFLNLTYSLWPWWPLESISTCMNTVVVSHITWAGIFGWTRCMILNQVRVSFQRHDLTQQENQCFHQGGNLPSGKRETHSCDSRRSPVAQHP